MSLDRDHEAPDARQDDGALPGSAHSTKAGSASVPPGRTTAHAGTQLLDGGGNGAGGSPISGGRPGSPESAGAGQAMVDDLLSDLLGRLSGLCGGAFRGRL